jgi:hypothetical protein
VYTKAVCSPLGSVVVTSDAALGSSLALTQFAPLIRRMVLTLLVRTVDAETGEAPVQVYGELSLDLASHRYFSWRQR